VSAEADFSIHGMYSHNNLFEGNLCHNIYYADYWGPTGPKTTSFRNRVFGADTLEGVYVDDFSHRANVIANDISGLASLGTDGTSDSLFIEGNVISGTPEWNTLPSSSQLPPSLYLESKPSFWIDVLDWPAYGPDVPNSGTNDIPASYNGGVGLFPAKKKAWKRNIALLQIGKRIHISGIPEGVITVNIFSVNGKIITSSTGRSKNSKTHVDLPGIASGMYVAQVGYSNVVYTKPLFIRGFRY
jgi:hypothetical protein